MGQLLADQQHYINERHHIPMENKLEPFQYLDELAKRQQNRDRHWSLLVGVQVGNPLHQFTDLLSQLHTFDEKVALGLK